MPQLGQLCILCSDDCVYSEAGVQQSVKQRFTGETALHLVSSTLRLHHLLTSFAVIMKPHTLDRLIVIEEGERDGKMNISLCFSQL